MMKTFSVVACLFICDLSARDLGIHGTLFPVNEVSFLDLIKTRLKNLEKDGKLTHLQRIFSLKAEERVQRPLSLSKLERAENYQSYLHNPEFVALKDYVDHKGRIFFQKGQKINPLDTHSWGEPLLLIDGDDEEQVTWVKAQKGKVVLTHGAPLALEKELKRAVYFDQAGLIVKRFHIPSLPCKISQKNKHLLVEMIPVALKGKGL